MIKSVRLKKAAAAAAIVLAAGSASAATFVPELGIGKASGKDIDRSGETTRDTWTYTAAFGVVSDMGLGARVIAIADADPYRGFLLNGRSFDNFVGLQGTGALPLGEKFKLTGGLGVGRTKLDGGAAAGATSKSITDGLVSVGVQWQPVAHYAMELRVQHLTTSSVTSTSLQFQVPF